MSGNAGKPTAIDLVVSPDRVLRWGGKSFSCALGAGGVRPDKHEGDGATPVGCFALRRVLYRPDRVPAPRTALPVLPLVPGDAWCDDPDDPHYNQQVRQPFAGGFEILWRDDHLYDVIVVLGHNDSPVVAGRGSAVFLHVTDRDYAPTQGCVALAGDDLLLILEGLDPQARLCVVSGAD